MRKNRIKAIWMLLAAALVLAGFTARMSFAETYHTISVEYRFSDGTHAYDPYKAVYADGSDIDVQITNPVIPGYKPVSSLEEGAPEVLKTTIRFENLSEDQTILVYYVPAQVNYRVRYYFQNIENDLYTEDLSLPPEYTDKSGVTGTYPAELEAIEFEGFTTLFHEPDVIAADGSTVFQIYYDRNYVLMNFDLNGGYGVEPVYAKYGTAFNIAEPEKSGYVFKGWQDKNGTVTKFTSGTVPAKDVTYTAVWEAVNTGFTVIYWTENANDDGYSYAGSESKDAVSGTLVSSDTYADEWNDPDKDYFIYDDTRIEEKRVEGDGSTVLNVYYQRREYTLKFYYARKQEANITSRLTSIDSGRTYKIYCTRSQSYLTSGRYSTYECLAFGAEEGFKLTKANDANGYYITDAQGRYLYIGNGTAGMTSEPTVINVTYNATDDYWNFSSTDGCYLNDWAGEHNRAAGWNGGGAATDIGSRWYVYYHGPVVTYQIPTFTNYFDATLGDNPVISQGSGGYQNTWCTVNGADPPILSERCQATQGEETVGDYIYCYFTVTGKYEENLAGKWPLNKDIGNVKANNRWCFFGAWNPTKSNYYIKHNSEFGGNTTVKGEYQKLDPYIMIEGHPEQTIIPFLAFWTNSNNPGWNLSRQWLYYIHVPVLDGETAENTHVYNGVTYKNHAIYNTFDTNDAYNEQTPTALDGFTHSSTTWEQNANDFVLEHEGGTTSMVSYNAHFYYRRNSYSLVFTNKDELEYTVPYETLLTEYNYTPVYPDAKQKEFYQFAGWYTTSECYDGTEFDFSKTMPANNIILFAKWEKVTHNVTFYNDYNDYVGRTDALKTASIVHNELMFTSDVPTQLNPPVGDAQFAGWYYFDNRNQKVRFDPQSIPVTKDLALYAEWSSKVTANFCVEYVEQGTGIPVADATAGTAFIGKTKTFQAKGNDALNAAHAWKEGGENWWPVVPSHSILIEQNTQDAQPNTYVFEYIKKASVGYSVRYVNVQTGEEVSPPVTHESNYSIVSEHFVYVPNMIADAVSKTLVLAAYDTVEEEYRNNVITFYYTPNSTEALYQVNHHIQNLDGSGYTLYSTQTKIVTLNGEIIPTDSAISISGYVFAPELTQVNGTIEAGKTEADGNILIVDLYYNRLTYGYIVYYREYGSENTILATIDHASDHEILGSTVTHTAPSELTLGDTLYARVGSAERTLEIRADAGSPPTLNVINVYYQKKTFYTVNYKAVCIPETSRDFGQVSLDYEIIDGDAEPNGSTAMLLDDVRYVFKGWYSDPQGTKQVGSTVYFKPSVAQDATYYAVFGMRTADLTINQNGGAQEDHFLYRITDEKGQERIVSVTGGGSVTIRELPCGEYTVTEITEWDWRYHHDPDGTQKKITVNTAQENAVTFQNTPNDKNWLGGEAATDNLFS
ncbi:MAG: InlB B-repeat-containing protein [Oscillospiraceae bacterium]|nr:InlB B-repeat-containing protein [Oscillospiraceae bacterium]